MQREIIEREIIEGYRLSPQQEHLWLLLDQGGAAPYRAQCSVVMRGHLDKARLKAAIGRVIERHEILRTSFQCLPGMQVPLQVINEAYAPTFEEHDLSHLETAEQQSAVSTLEDAARRENFSYTENPLKIVKLVILGEAKHLLLISLHAFCADQLSLKNLLHEVSNFYASEWAGDEPDDELMQYIVVSEWQHQLLEAEETEIGRGYWRSQNLSSFGALKLPCERKTSLDVPFTPQHFTLTLEGELTEKIAGLAAQHETSTNVLLLACWQVLLARLSGQPEMITGVAFDGRLDDALAGAIGLFTKYLPIHTRLDDEPGFVELLQRVAEAEQDARQWQEYFSWEQLEDDGGDVERLFWPFCFSVHEGPAEFAADGLTFKVLTQYACLDRFNLELRCGETGGKTEAVFRYNAQLYREREIERLAGQFRQLLISVIASPTERIGRLRIAPETEISQVLFEWNLTRVEDQAGLCVHQLFERQAERTPDNIAVVSDGQSLTYGELNRRANRLAHHLRAQNVGTESLVGIMLERSIEMVVGLLGVLKSGGAYLPLDPAYPSERLAFMLADAGAQVILTQEKFLDAMPTDGALSLCLDSQWSLISRQPETNPDSAAVSKSLAYVIYTSGSTGKPKGVMIEHGALGNHMLWMQRRLPLLPHHSVLQKTPFSFDASVWEFYAPLLAGARLVMARPLGHKDAAYLIRTMIAEQVTRLQLVPTLLQALVEEEGLEECESLIEVFCGGEALSAELVKKMQRRLPHAEIYNLYGPTETCIDATWWTCQREAKEERAAEQSAAEQSAGEQLIAPIGRPVDNATAYVLNSELEPVAVWEAGELYIGGEGVGRGYLSRPELTAERFIPNPFETAGGARMYRTGDRARFLDDGQIEFLGRADHQLKVRGHRIELGEIESVLAAHETVRECCVAAREAGAGVKNLVAYVVGTGAATISVDELREYLRRRLPEHMLPHAFVLLEEMPLAPNGKIDRQRLPAPGSSQDGGAATQVAPRSPVEDLVAQVWAQVLGVERVGVNDNFFELGGHSLLATQVITRLSTAFQTEVPLRSLFETPTLGGLAQTIEAGIKAGQGAAFGPVLPASREGELPLSFAQQRLWFLDQLEPGNPFYNVPVALRLNGQLDVRAVQQSLNEIMRRHEVLRTSFTNIDGRPVQVISSEASLILSQLNLEESPAQEREAMLRDEIARAANQPFDLSRELLLRASLLRFSEDEHVFILTMHHLVTDAWSMKVFTREMAALYESFAGDAPASLPELSIQYADFALWQREWLQGAVLETQLGYWRQQLEDIPAQLEFPSDRVRPALQSFRGAKRLFTINETLTAELKALSRREGVTLFMALLAIFKTLLQRYTGRDDIVVGSPVANRSRAEFEDLIGFFANSLVLRTDLSGDPTFRELLGRIRRMALGAYAHQDLPFEKMVEELQPQRDLSRNPLFQVMFVMQNDAPDMREHSQLKITPLDTESDSVRLDLTLHLAEAERELNASVLYATDLFDETTMDRVSAHFLNLLEGIVSDAEQRLSELPLLSAAERHQLLFEWNATAAFYADEVCPHHLIEAQAERDGKRVAIVHEGGQLSYEGLERRAHVLAIRLREHGVGAEVKVGLCVERSPEMLIGILAILKAGGAYVPLDPHYPRERLAYMIKDAAMPVVLTRQALAESLPEHEATIICLDDDAARGAKETGARGVRQAALENLAYVIYTSGSTGKPKGVLATHRNLLHSTRARFKYYGEPVGKFLLLSSFAFDSSIAGIFWTLCEGGSLVLPPAGFERDPAQLIELIERNRITHLLCLPSLYDLLLDESASRELDSLRVVIVAGETCPSELLQRHRQLLPQVALFNEYGPTEVSVWSLVYKAEQDRQRVKVPIGHPIENTQAYLLDGRGQIVPVGVTGELYLSGIGVTRGYLNRPAQTAERFLPDSFSNEPGRRLYRTGDLARYLPDGMIDFLGRTDRQVKIRGFRIETGEIEDALARHPLVRDAVVAARADAGSNRQRLVAYLTLEGAATKSGETKGAETLSGRALAAFLKDKLPDYMLPSAYVFLESLPRTQNGKVDMQSLPAPQDDRSALAARFEAARTPSEEIMAGIWSDVLGAQRISVHDNFFELGGHSLLAPQIISRVRRAFDVEMPLRTVFESPTVAELTAKLEQLMKLRRGFKVPDFERVPRGRELPLSFAQQRLWFIEQVEPGDPVYNLSMAVRLEGRLDVAALTQAFNELIARHEVLRTSFATNEGRAVQIVSEVHELTLHLTDLSARTGLEREESVRQLAREEALKPFDLTRAPLLRMSLLRLEEQEHVLLLTMHHIASDGWSMGVLVREIAALYEALARGEKPSLPELHFQYADFAAWQRRWLGGEVLENQLAYWKRQLADLPLMQLPTDHPRPAVLGTRAALESFQLPADLSNELKALSRSEGVTLFMTLLATFQTLLSAYTGQTDIVVGTDSANRNHTETEGLIGFFINQLVLRTDLSGNPTFRELLQRVRATMLDAYEHQEVPFDRLVEALNPERALTRMPLFQIKIVLQNTPQTTIELPDLKLQQVEADHGTSPFDLTLLFMEGEQGLHGSWIYNIELFERETLRRMQRHYVALLRRLLDAPDSPLGQTREMFEELDRQYMQEAAERLQSFRLQKFKSGRRRAVGTGGAPDSRIS